MTRIGHPDSDSAPVQVPPAPAVARALFGAQLESAQAYAQLLATDGIAHGLLGPREVPRLWDRHLVNSALLTDLVPTGARVVDVGSGAGLPGVAMALRRPDLRIDTVEPMLRRVEFLTDVVTRLALGDRVRVVRGRAEEAATRDTVGAAQWVVARAVAPLDRLVKWCLPLLTPGGTLLAIKGATAEQELVEHAAALARLGAGPSSVQELREGEAVTWVVSVTRSPAKARRRSR